MQKSRCKNCKEKVVYPMKKESKRILERENNSDLIRF